MTKLVTVERFREKFGIEDIDAVNDIVRQTLESVSLHLESLLPTKLTRQSREEVFWIHPEVIPFNSEYIKLVTSSCFINGNVQLISAPSLKDLASNINVSEEPMLVDNDKGTIHLLDTDRFMKGGAVRVNYDAGLLVKDDGIFGTLYADVPNWLEEAAYLLTIMATQDRLYGGKNQGPVSPVTPAIFLRPYVRTDVSAYRALVVK